MIAQEKFYTAYSNFHAEPGDRISLRDELHFCGEKIDLLPFALESPEVLAALKEKSEAGEKEIGEAMKALLEKWEQQASITMLLERALDYQKAPLPDHTGNEWRTRDSGRRCEISNMVYIMRTHIDEQTSYDRSVDEYVPTAWYVSWNLSLNAHTYRSRRTIASQRKKRYTDKEEAQKYLEGRKAYYEHLFYKISPPIPPEYADYFKVNGLLLPGYTVEGQSLPVVEKTAMEVLEELGGVFAPKKEGFSLDGDSAPPKAKTSKQSHHRGQER